MNNWHKTNFNTLLKAAAAGKLVLIDAVDVKTGEPVAVIAASNDPVDGKVQLAPLAKLFDGNAYEEVVPAGSEPGAIREGA